MMPPIFLIGFMCSGKTTLGRALAARLGVEFVDLDHYIEHRTGLAIPQIFQQFGETAFRVLEHDALQQVCSRSDVVVACGGGTPCQPGAMELMNASGITVQLVPSEHRLLRRLMAGRHKRPLLAEISDIDEMRDFMIFTIAMRTPHYCKAKYRFDSSALDSQEEIDQSVQDFIDKILGKR